MSNGKKSVALVALHCDDARRLTVKVVKSI